MTEMPPPSSLEPAVGLKEMVWDSSFLLFITTCPVLRCMMIEVERYESLRDGDSSAVLPGAGGGPEGDGLVLRGESALHAHRLVCFLCSYT